MRIDIDEHYAVESYEYGWMVVRRTIGKSGKSKGKEQAKKWYYTTLQSAFTAVGDRMLRDSPAVGVRAALEAATDIGRKLGKLLDEARLPKQIKGRAA